MNRRLIPVLAVAFLAVTAIDSTPTTARPAVASVSHATNIPVTLRALARLRSYGYTWSSDQGADRAIRAWQRANGLTVDGIVGIQTSASLGLGSESVGVAGVLKLVPSSPAAPTVPAVRVNPPAGSVEDIIRNAWPDDLEDHAIQIATRESRLQPGVRNACCYGLFQLNWKAHRGWMSEFGVTSPDQLFDPRTNAEMAYQLYLRDGGWGPWSL